MRETKHLVLGGISTEQIAEAVKENSSLEAVTQGISVQNTPFTALLERISKRKVALSPEEQYANWSLAFQAIGSNAKKAVESLDKAFLSSWNGGVHFQGFPIIDSTTYWAIRRRERFSRTWFFKLGFMLPASREELVFYFNNNSLPARERDPQVAFSASLHIGLYERSLSRYAWGMGIPWLRVKEIVFNGVDVGILTGIGTDLQDIQYGLDFETWFAWVVEDILKNRSDIEL